MLQNGMHEHGQIKLNMGIFFDLSSSMSAWQGNPVCTRESYWWISDLI